MIAETTAVTQHSQRGASDVARWVGAGSAVAVGAFGWLLAHLVTFWLAAHSHPDAAGLSGWHVHGVVAGAGVVAGGLAAVCVMAMLLARWWARGRTAWSVSPGRAAVHLAVGLSSGAFLAADAVEHVLFELAPTPPALLVLGLLLHALFGAGSSLLWLTFTDHIRRVLGAIPPPATGGARRPGTPDRRPRRPRRLLWAAAVAQRAPPAGC